MRLKGDLELQDYVGDSEGRFRIDVNLLSADGTAVVESLSSIAGGPSSLDVILQSPPGDYILRIKASTFLARRTGVISLSSGVNGEINVSLINGDSDGDNEVGPGDFGIISSAFGAAPGDTNWAEEADLDGDGEVGPSDFGIVSANFGTVGDE